MKLRNYQQAAADSVHKLFADGEKSALIVLPTGTGKTITFASVIDTHLKEYGGRAIVLAHRAELIYQAAKKIRQVTGKQVDIEMAEHRANHGLFQAPVIVSTIQTQNAGNGGDGRKALFDHSDASLVIVDEGHHAPAASYRKVLDYYKQNDKVKLLGVTATPDRADKKALGQVYDNVAYNYELPDAIHDGWLVPIRQQMIHATDLDLSACRTTAGDLNAGDLSRAMTYEKPLHQIAWPTFHIANGRKTLVFAASIAHAEMLTKIFNRHEEGCARFVHGKTDKDERRQMFKDYSNGEFWILVNVGVATEGFDEPGIKVVSLARPTKSRALYTQMVGRGTRPLEDIAHHLGDCADEAARRAMIEASDKQCVEILDFVGNSGKHKLISTADILGGDYSPATIERAKKKATETEEPVDMELMLEVAEKELEEELDLHAHMKVKTQYTKSDVDPFDVLDIHPARQRNWDTGSPVPASEKQIKMLKWQGIPTQDITKRKAGQLISEIFKRKGKGLCTYRQATKLEKLGYSKNTSAVEAKRILDRVIKKQASRY